MSEPWENSTEETLETHCFSVGGTSAIRPSSTRSILTHWLLGCSTMRILFWLAAAGSASSQGM